MREERLRILEMVREGKITTDEGLELLEALDGAEVGTAQPGHGGKARFVHIRVREGDKNYVNVNIPLGLVRVAGKFAGLGLGFIPAEARAEMESRGIDLRQLDLEALLKEIEGGLVQGKIVEITSETGEGPAQVEIYVD